MFQNRLSTKKFSAMLWRFRQTTSPRLWCSACSGRPPPSRGHSKRVLRAGACVLAATPALESWFHVNFKRLTFRGAFSAVSTPIFASKSLLVGHLFCNVFWRSARFTHLCTAPNSKFAIILQNVGEIFFLSYLKTIFTISCWICAKICYFSPMCLQNIIIVGIARFFR